VIERPQLEVMLMDTLLNQRAHSPPSITPVSADGKMAIRQPGESRKNLRFETVSMHDLSAGGFSFWADVWPRYAEVVFPVVGTHGAMLSHVCKVERIGDHCLVHCQFVRRMAQSD
jgi:hypothetical protein